MFKNQKGFGTLELLLVILIVGIVGAAGWYVWKAQENKSENSEEPRVAVTEDLKINELHKTFDCQGQFTVKYSEPLKATITDSDYPQCLISNVTEDEMPPVGPLPPEQFALTFSVSETSVKTNQEYLEILTGRGEGLGALELISQEELKLDNGKTAILAKVYGGHPAESEYTVFIYVKNGVVVETFNNINAANKELAISILKTVN